MGARRNRRVMSRREDWIVEIAIVDLMEGFMHARTRNVKRFFVLDLEGPRYGWANGHVV